MKLAVGISDLAHLQRAQAARAIALPPLRHRTRHIPRRAAEITEGGSIYWVISGMMLARQRVLDIIEDRQDDGSNCAGILLDPALVAVAGRPVKAFQGWRYLEHAAAPPDLANARTPGAEALPAELRQQLQALCLL